MIDTPIIPDFINKLEDVNQLRNVINNARAKGRDDVATAALRRMFEVQGMKYDDPLHQDFYKMLAAYEQLLTEKNDRNTRATRTRQKLGRTTVEQCMEDWAMDKHSTQGFAMLMENGYEDLTAEALIIKYSDRFPLEVVAGAKDRLEKALESA